MQFRHFPPCCPKALFSKIVHTNVHFLRSLLNWSVHRNRPKFRPSTTDGARYCPQVSTKRDYSSKSAHIVRIPPYPKFQSLFFTTKLSKWSGKSSLAFTLPEWSKEGPLTTSCAYGLARLLKSTKKFIAYCHLLKNCRTVLQSSSLCSVFYCPWPVKLLVSLSPCASYHKYCIQNATRLPIVVSWQVCRFVDANAMVRTFKCHWG